MKIALAQINTKIGDFKENREKILRSISMALSQGVDLIVFPELAPVSYTHSEPTTPS